MRIALLRCAHTAYILVPYLVDTVTMRVQAKSPSRKKQFEAALKLAGLTVDQWATDHNITRQHLWYVFRGDRKPSAALDTAISSFIESQLNAIA